ncbi:phosphodiester glycosidase family protein [Paenibacillus sp. TAB 01]|uniref:phosphodiester glycosidase family protein n=1 Tax=Paenibacillus sp. TAB 01 TaxID=3368988 RepID=UPI003753C6F9
MSSGIQLLKSTRRQIRHWSWLKRTLLMIALIGFLSSSFLFLTGPGTQMRIWMAQTVIITQHRDWAWIFVGAEQRDELIRQMQEFVEDNSKEKQQSGLIKTPQRRIRSMDELIKVEDISGTLWKGKRMYVYDPKSIRLMTPAKSGEGEKITSMVQRTGAVAGVNAGGFNDPEGLGNGFAALGAVISGGDVIYTDQDGTVPQHIVGFLKDGTLIIGKYTINELLDMGISEAASFYPRVIANGKPLAINDNSRAPRTAVGQKADGTVIFIVIDGRQTHSVGATLKEVQDLFMEDGVINAGFLDGGASSEMVVNGELITKPSSRYGERRLPSAFLVYSNPEDVVANRVWDGVDKIDPGGSYDHPDYLKEQAELKAKQKNNPTTTTTPSKTETDKSKSTESGSSGSTKAPGTGTSGSSDKDTGKTGSGSHSSTETDTEKPATSNSTKDNTTTKPPAGTTQPPSSNGNNGNNGSGSTETNKPAQGAGTTTKPTSPTEPAVNNGSTGAGTTSNGSGSGSNGSSGGSGTTTGTGTKTTTTPTTTTAPTTPTAPTPPSTSSTNSPAAGKTN